MKKTIIVLVLVLIPGGIFALNGSFNASNNTNVSGDINYLRLDTANDPVTGNLELGAGLSVGVIFELNSDGDLIPTENGGIDDFFEINADGDITPRLQQRMELNEDGDIIPL